MTQNSRTGDLTSGPMLQKIILFSLPLAASSILQLLFNAADVVVVGRFAGSTALAAVGSNGALINLLVNLFVGLSLGANVVAARCFGAKDEEGVHTTVQTSVTLGLVSGLFLAVVGIFAARGLLELMSCPEDVIDLSTLYLKIYFIGMPMTMLYNFSSALLRAVGDTKRPLFCLAVASWQHRGGGRRVHLAGVLGVSCSPTAWGRAGRSLVPCLLSVSPAGRAGAVCAGAGAGAGHGRRSQAKRLANQQNAQRFNKKCSIMTKIMPCILCFLRCKYACFGVK